MNIVLSYPNRYDFSLDAHEPYAQRRISSLSMSIDCYRVKRQSIDTFLSRAYMHCRERNVRQDHLSSPYVWRYADVEIHASRKRCHRLALAVCAPPGYLTRRLHYLSGDNVVERAESGLWIAYTPSSDVIASDSLFVLIESLK